VAKRLARLCILLLALAHVAATCKGTETGNPQNSGGQSGCPALVSAQSGLLKSATGSDAALDDLILKICQRIIGCGVVTTTDTCFNALNGEDGDLMTDEFGRPAGTTIVQLRSDLISGHVIASSTEEPVCVDDIAAVDCSDVTANVSGGDFSGVENIIPASCVNAFAGVEGATDQPSPTSGGCP